MITGAQTQKVLQGSLVPHLHSVLSTLYSPLFTVAPLRKRSLLPRRADHPLVPAVQQSEHPWYGDQETARMLVTTQQFLLSGGAC